MALARVFIMLDQENLIICFALCCRLLGAHFETQVRY